jgi:hypothetical protein
VEERGGDAARGGGNAEKRGGDAAAGGGDVAGVSEVSAAGGRNAARGGGGVAGVAGNLAAVSGPVSPRSPLFRGKEEDGPRRAAPGASFFRAVEAGVGAWRSAWHLSVGITAAYVTPEG